ncbi:MAG: hypothetical protein ACRDH6_03915 [Actinomycetota bacterium]
MASVRGGPSAFASGEDRRGRRGESHHRDATGTNQRNASGPWSGSRPERLGFLEKYPGLDPEIVKAVG